MRPAHQLTTVFGLALCAALCGCVVFPADREPPPPPPPSFGTLTALWTLNGSASPSACAFYDIDRVDIVVYDAAGVVAVAAQPFCEDFGASFDLTAGYHTIRMTLLAFGGLVASDDLIIDERVDVDTEVLVDVDFPDASIF